MYTLVFKIIQNILEYTNYKNIDMTTGEDTTIPEGIYSPVPTFFKDDATYSLDIETQIKHAKMLYSSGINGLVVAGSMGEASHLTRNERSILFKSIREAIPDTNFKIIAGVPPLSIQDTISDIESASEAHADYSIVLVPGYFGPSLTSQQGIIDYFIAVAEKLPLPIIIYNYPGVSNNVDIKIETFEKLLLHPKIVGVKLTHFNLDKYTLLTGNSTLNKINNFRSFTGLGQVLVPSLSIGAFGAIDGLSGIFPKCMLKIFSLYKEKEFEKALELQYLVTKADQMIMELNLVGVKYALNTIYGFGEVLTGRPPLNIEVNDNTWKKHENALNALLKIERTL